MSTKPPVNEDIRNAELLLIDHDGKALGKVSYDQAMWLAWESDLDVVVVGPNAKPPVAKLMDYGKFQYEQAKAEQKSKKSAPEVKEIRMRLKIGQHDFDVKRAQAARWLADGDRVRVTVRLMGREMMFAERANVMIERIREALDAEIESPPRQVGNRVSTLLQRKKNS